MVKKSSAAKKSEVRNEARTRQPPTWYFPTSIDGKFIACDWNDAEQRYNLNCREVDRKDLHSNLSIALVRATNAVEKYS